MALTLFVLALVAQQTILVRSQKVPASGGNKVAAQQGKPGNSGLLQCEFQGSGRRLVVVAYNSTEYECLKCHERTQTLYQKRKNTSKSEICKKLCNGILCGNTCARVKPNGLSQVPTCLAGKAMNWRVDEENERGAKTRDSQVPLIIGFTVGGILLAIVVVGIFLGRQQKTDNTEGSEVATTPVSLSNSEWHFNGGSGSTRRTEENLRVQEASTEDLEALPNTTYAMQNYNKDFRKDENGNEFLPKARADTSSIGQESYKDDDIPFYYPQYGSELTRSNRSSDILLEDGYVSGGNFVGSADPQVHRLLSQKGQSSATETPGFEEHGDRENHFFDGRTPASMTHDAICMSLTHSSNNYGEVEYVIEDQDLVAFDTPDSLARQPPMLEKRVPNGDEDTMQLDLEYRDVDSDFEDHESHPNSAVKSDRSDAFFSSDTQSPDGEREHYHTRSGSSVMQDSPFSESGIEASCHSKDSSEVIPENGSSQRAFRSYKSMNENCKGPSNELAEMDDMKRRQKMVKCANRSKSYSWKSPSAPTHSCSRQQTVSVHCPSSEPAHSRPRHSNLTHVFVDVHRDMAGSDEDLLAQETDLRRTYRNPSATDSETSFSEIPLSALQVTPDHTPYDVTFPSSSSPDTKLAKKKRNKSMYILRNGGIERTRNLPPRTVRFSSSGSGEYAIPFGSLVP